MENDNETVNRVADPIRPAAPDDGSGAASLEGGPAAAVVANSSKGAGDDAGVSIALDVPNLKVELLAGPFFAGDLAQWLSPLCVCRIVEALDWGYYIEPIPGINGNPLDVKAGEVYSVGFSCIAGIPAGVVIPDELLKAGE